MGTDEQLEFKGGEDSFASLFEASMAEADLGREGEIVVGTVVHVGRDNVVVDIGGKSEGVIALGEFTGPDGQILVKAGDRVDVYIESRENDEGLVALSKEKADKMKVWDEISSACERDELIDGTISQRVKGGLSVAIRGGVKAFLPGSQVDLRPIRNLDKLIGQTYQFKVIKFNKKRGNIVLSRRVLLEKERDEMKAKTLQSLTEGMIVKGVIKNITEYGAFVDLGGIDGLLHITDMSWGRITDPKEVFQVGDEVTVKVLKYNPETERVSLGLKQTQEDPWNHAEEAYPQGKKVRGKVMSITDYGAFIELEPGIEGLIHVSEMSWTKKVKHPSKIVEPGQEIECQILEVDAKAKRISLGLKQLEPDPWTVFTDKYSPGDRIIGKVRSLTDYGVFVGIEEGVDGMVHKSDLSWTVKVQNPSDLFHKGDEVEAIILSINHDEKKVSLGIRQLFDDPWPTIFSEFPPSRVIDECRVLAVVDYGCFVKIRDGVEAFIASNDMDEEQFKGLKLGENIRAEISNIDMTDRRLIMSAKNIGEVTRPVPKAAQVQQNTSSKATFGDLFKDKLTDFGKKLPSARSLRGPRSPLGDRGPRCFVGQRRSACALFLSMKSPLPAAFLRHPRVPCLQAEDVQAAIREGTSLSEDREPRLRDSFCSVGHFLDIYRFRLQHLSRFKSPHGRRLHAQVSALCEALERQPPQADVSLSSIHFGRGQAVTLLERADTHELLGCLVTVDRREVSEEEWAALWW